jgi:hypothetical protein
MANGLFNPTISESKAYHFTNSSFFWSSVIIPNIATGEDGEHLNFTSSDDFSISVWCYWDSAAAAASSTYGRVYSKAGASNTYIQYMLSRDTDAKISFRTKVGTGSQITTKSTTVMADDVWYHVIITYDSASTTMKLYVNGEFEVSATNHVIVDQGFDSLVVGGQYGATESPDDLTVASRWFGGIDELAFWSTVLSADSVKQVYNDRNMLDLTTSIFYYTSPGSLVGWYRLGDENEDLQLNAGLQGEGDLVGSAYDQSDSDHSGLIYDMNNTTHLLDSRAITWNGSAWVVDYLEAGIGFNSNAGMFNGNELTGLNSKISLKLLDYTDPEGDGPQVKEYNGIYFGLNRMNGFVNKAHMEAYSVPAESGYNWTNYDPTGYNATSGRYHRSLNGYSPELLNAHLNEEDVYLGDGNDFYRTWGHFSWGPFNDLSPLDFIEIGFVQKEGGGWRFEIKPRFEENGEANPRIASYLNPGKYLVAMRFEEFPSPIIIMDTLHLNKHWNIQDQLVTEGYGKTGVRAIRQAPNPYSIGDGTAIRVDRVWAWKSDIGKSFWWTNATADDDPTNLNNYTRKYIITSIPLWTALGFDAVLDENGDVQRDSLLDKWFSTRVYMNFDEPHWNVNIYSKVSASEACTIGALYGMGGDVDVQDRITAQAGLMVTANAVTENDSYFRVMEGVVSEFNDKVRVGGTIEIGKGIKTGNLNQNSEAFRINYNEDDDSLDFTFFQE